MDQCQYHNITGEISELASFSEASVVTTAALTIIIMLVGLVGNALTVIALMRSPRVRNIAAAFIISLCVADFMFCLLVLPFSASRFINRGWTHGPFLCTIYPLLQYGNLGVSLLSIAMVTINRYIMITSNSIFTRIYKPIWIGCMIAFCWIFSFIMQVPTLAGVWGQFGYDEKLQTCTIIRDENGGTSKHSLFVIAFVIPCLIIIFCYARIFWTVHKSETRMRQHSARSDPREIKTKRNEWRITKMVLVIFISFVTCYLPITIVKVTDKCVGHPVMHLVGYVLVYASACINPIIYVFMNKQYRHAFKAVLCPASLAAMTSRVTFQSSRSKGPGVGDLNSQTMVSRMTVTNCHYGGPESEDPL